MTTVTTLPGVCSGKQPAPNEGLFVSSGPIEPYLCVSVADPLDLDDEDEIVGRVDEEGD